MYGKGLFIYPCVLLLWFSMNSVTTSGWNTDNGRQKFLFWFALQWLTFYLISPFSSKKCICTYIYPVIHPSIHSSLHIWKHTCMCIIYIYIIYIYALPHVHLIQALWAVLEACVFYFIILGGKVGNTDVAVHNKLLSTFSDLVKK